MRSRFTGVWNEKYRSINEYFMGLLNNKPNIQHLASVSAQVLHSGNHVMEDVPKVSH